MTVYDFCYLCTDDSAEVSIYDMHPANESEVFKGTMRDAMDSAWADHEVFSFDLYLGFNREPEAVLTLNIDTSMD